MQLIIAGSADQARACARIKGLDPGQYIYVTNADAFRGASLSKGDTVLFFGTYRNAHMFEWRDWVQQIQRRGGRTEEVVDGRLTGGTAAP